MSEWVVKEDSPFRAWVKAVDAERQALGIVEEMPNLEAAIERWRARKPSATQPQMRLFLIVVEQVDGHYRAYSPEIGGCLAEGDSPAGAKAALVEVLQARLAALMEQGEMLPARVTLDVVKVHLPAAGMSG